MVKVINNGKKTIWKYTDNEWKMMIEKSKEPFFKGYKPKFYFKLGENK